MSRCDHTGELLSVYLDGELRAEELAVVVAHLDACPACVASFVDLKRVRAALRTLPSLELPAELAAGHSGAALSAYLDGELGADEHRRITEHLRWCDRCRDELHEVDAARTAIRSLPRLEPAVVVPAPVTVAPAPRRRRTVALVAAVAAAVLAVAVARANDAPGPQVDLDLLANRHNARLSVESGFAVIPAVSPAEERP